MKKLILLIFILLSLGIAAFLFLFRTSGSNTFTDIYNSFQVVMDGEAIDKSYYDRVEGQYYFTLDFIKEYIDPNVSYDESSKTVQFNNEAGKKSMVVGEKKALLNDQTIGLRDPLFEKEGKLFIPIEAFLYDYPYWASFNMDHNILVLENKTKEYATAKPKGDGVNMRLEGALDKPIVKTLNSEDVLTVYREENGWYNVRNHEGFGGWVRGDNLEISEIDGQISKEKESPRKSAIGKPINITWDYTYGKVKDSVISAIKPIPGLDAMIPTWFSIDNADGDLIDRGDARYAKAYAAQGIDLWGYVDNKFDKDLSKEFLSNETGRANAIKNLVAAAKKYGMKGINVDFENMNIEERDPFTVFVEELSLACKENNLILSVCVTPQISSNVEDEPYNRAALAKVADYVILMAYDQHWGSSDTAGSVAEYKWVESNVNILLKDIPQEKFILSIPFYTRLWKEGSNNVESTPVGMETTRQYIQSHGMQSTWDDNAKQYYIEMEKDGKVEKIWIEDAQSLQWKTSLVRKYNLAGVSSWRYGFETNDIWPMIQNELSHYNFMFK
ncbi:SH3 domain-containing protein [Peptoniphilus sp. KCTC 25270]|uniref:glycosyl hydrolase family 18 protein n=1 Tax=Peptoniphilus sp. KCTC 25270 TaxID=2897414 RepID=UPI001E332A19|nr:glycosyl hydrolase family 18 protein [Peptoniphilus sp. KCTC 25270]MCD1147052.1 SH3 domain-containing protein [Peptoniphilus sp. KCTC 25270]